MPAITADTVKAKSFTFSARQPRKRVRLSASRTATSSLPYFERTIAQVTKTPSASASAEIENSAVHRIASAVLGRSYEVYVKLPPGYDKPENAQRRYPVVYLNDGPYAFQAASGVTRVTFSQHRFEEFVIVGIGYAVGEVPMDSRRRDYTPVVDPSKPGATGGAAAYLGFLKGEVLPFVERTYRIDPARRTLAGQSYGGLKTSGIGREFSLEGMLDSYTERKHISVALTR